MSTDLFGGTMPEREPLPLAQFHERVQWNRLDLIQRPACMHCQMLAHYGHRLDVRKARWTRVGRDGSVLELCDAHSDQQRERDGRERLFELKYEALAGAIVDAMEDPDDWDDGERPATPQLIEYVQYLALKIHDINLVLDRDMKEKK